MRSLYHVCIQDVLDAQINGFENKAIICCPDMGFVDSVMYSDILDSCLYSIGFHVGRIKAADFCQQRHEFCADGYFMNKLSSILSELRLVYRLSEGRLDINESQLNYLQELVVNTIRKTNFLDTSEPYLLLDDEERRLSDLLFG